MEIGLFQALKAEAKAGISEGCKGPVQTRALWTIVENQLARMGQAFPQTFPRASE